MTPDLGSFLLRKSVGTTADDRPRCAGCRRTPLTGEELHLLESNRKVCALCLARMPEEERRVASTERVHAGERPIAVAPAA